MKLRWPAGRWRRALLAVALLGALAGVTVWTIVSTTAGARWFMRLLPRLGAPITVAEVRGKLRGPLELYGVRIGLESASLQIDRTVLEPRLLGLLRARLTLDEIEVDGVSMIIQSAEDEPPPTPPAQDRDAKAPRSPIEVVIHKGVVRDLSVRAPNQIEIDDGALTITGTLERYQLEATAVVSGPRLPPARLLLRGSGALDRLEIDESRVDGLDGSVLAQGRIAWAPDVEWEIAVEARDVAPSALLPDPDAWPGTVSLRANSRGVLSPSGPVGSVRLDTLTGQLRNQPLSGRGTLVLEGAGYRIDGLGLAWGETRLDAEGVVGDSLNVAFELDAPNLGAPLPDAAGALRLDGKVEGSRSAPTVRAQVEARGVRLAQVRLDQLTGAVSFDAGRPDEARLDLQATRVALGNRSIDRIDIRARGVRAPDDPGSIVLERAESDLLGGQLQVAGRFSWKPQPRWDLRLRAERLTPGSLLPDPEVWPGRLTLQANSAGRLTEAGPVGHVQIDTLFGSLRGQRLRGHARAQVDGSGYSLSWLDLEWGAARLKAAGEVAADLNLSFEIDAPDLGLAYPGAGGSLQASGRIGGTRVLPTIQAQLAAEGLELRDYRLERVSGRVDLGRGETQEIELDLQAEQLAWTQLQIDRVFLKGHGLRSERALVGLALDTVKAETLAGVIRAEGEVTWHPRRSWRLAVVGEGLAPASLFPEPEGWPGALSFRARSTGTVEAAGPAFEFQLDTLNGSLRGQSIGARAELIAEPPGYRLPELRLVWGPSRLDASGAIADELDLRFEVDASDLAMAWPDAAGALALSGRLSGTRKTPQLQGRVSGRSIALRDYVVGALTGRIDVDLGDPGTADITLEASDLRAGPRRIEQLSLHSRGSRTDHTVTVGLRSAEPNVDLEVQGGLDGRDWSGAIRRFDVRSGAAGNYRLAQPVPLRAGPNELRVGDLCLESATAAACGTGSWRREAGWDFASSFHQVPLAAVRPLLPPGWSMDGTLEGSAVAGVAADGALAATIELFPGPGTITYPVGVDTQTVRYDRGSFQLTAGPDGTRGGARLNLTTAGGAAFGRLNVDLELPAYTSLADSLRDQTVRGRLDIRLEDLSLLEALTTRITGAGGRIEADVEVTGTVESPRLLGELRLVEGRADLPQLGTRLREIEIVATGDGAGGTTFRGAAASGSGRLSVTGTTPLRPTPERPSRFRITGDRFQAMSTPEVQLLISPSVDVTVTGDQVVLDGEVRIPQANIHLREIPETAVPVSKDVVFVGPAVEPQPTIVAVSGRVRLVLGDEVSFRGFGFSAGLTGSVLAIEEPGKPTAGTGELVIRDGSYKAYGQNLTIDPGRVIFGGGPIDNPGLDVRAYRVASDSVIAGLLIKGTLKAPEVTLYSQPPMAESEALSYLILGRPLSEASRSEGNAVTRAAESLGLRGGNALARRVATTVGLDEARIETRGSLDQAAFVAGKYLSPKLYVSYGIGLFDHASTFRVRYLLSSRWTLVGETGRETSTDLLYRIEHGN